jgi:plasmid maintenance system killer protein
VGRGGVRLPTLFRVGIKTCPPYALHPLKGDRKGEWSMKVSGNWHITFSFTKGNAFDLNLEDYH